MYLGANSHFHFYALEVHRCPEAKLQRIAKACEQVEMDVWNACENFSTYLKKQSALLYAKQNNKIVGFALFDVTLVEKRLIVAANECMVLKKYQGFGLPTIFSAILASHIQKDNQMRGIERPYQAVTFLSTTVNFKLMAAFHRYDWLTTASSFKPDTEIEQVTKEYLNKESLSPLDSTNLFFLKEAFPNAAKTKAIIKAPAFVPYGFTPERGDAFLYVCRIEKFLLLDLISKWSRLRYGFKFSKRLIPITRLAREGVMYSR